MNLSASSLGIFESCSRCFYLEKNNKIARPRGIFPSLPSGIDRVLKVWADDLRSQHVMFPIESEKGDHFLFKDAAKLKKWQNWRSGLKWSDGKGNYMIGALDEVLVNASGHYVPTDYKTRGSETTKADVEKYYQRQLDVYALLLSTDAKVADYGFILSCFPTCIELGELGASADFDIQTFCLSADPERAKDLFYRALACLNLSVAPIANPDCEYCKYADQARNI